MTHVFLSAQWHHLAILNYEVPSELLQPHVPAGTQLDLYKDKALVSIVGFMFLNTRLKGIPIPFHRDFEEVNLRFYVYRMVEGQKRRGVVFIKEIVPKSALALVARWVYNENYVAMPMSHGGPDMGAAPTGPISYSWTSPSGQNLMEVTPQGNCAFPAADSEASFITEHYWGYSRQRDGSTVEYEVTHPQWQLWQTSSSRFVCNVAEIYGLEWAPYLAVKPQSALLALGSEVQVYDGMRLKA